MSNPNSHCKEPQLDFDSSMSTIRDIITCLPKSSLSRNNKRTSLYPNEDSQNNVSTAEQKRMTCDLQNSSAKKKNMCYTDTNSIYSSTSSSNSSQMQNLTQIIGTTKYNYSQIASKSKIFN